MSIIVFSGPSISIDDIKHHLPDADIRPPAKQGDIYIAVQEEPKIIALIDGFFERVPAVWHKEILYAMSRGIHVYGSSSMGALRAAELDSFGMVGIGEIYQQFTSGKLEDDDEVALIHAPAHLGYQPISRAMVDLRNDLSRTTERNLISTSLATCIEHDLKALWYPNRTLEALYEFAKPYLSQEELNSLTLFLGRNPPSLKNKDAVALIQIIASVDLAALPAKVVDFAFNENDAWQTLIINVEREKQAEAVKTFDIHRSLQNESEWISRLRAGALAHAEQNSIDETPWIRTAFLRIATKWQCLKEDGQPDFQKVSQAIHSTDMTVVQFDQWIVREARLLAYIQQTKISEEQKQDTLFEAYIN
ncbi:TfuA-like protein [Vibrio penaeicida]|uniref:TfuA-like protein n=1 Tax=Vibrio penaeicida TaxID=104609 RepID=UPI000CEA67C9|nr:TfuA-like protein [Vibrio penaeicida]